MFFLLALVLASLALLRHLLRRQVARRSVKRLTIHEEHILRLAKRRYYVNIRSHTTDAPLLLFLHGGPAVPLTPALHIWQPYLEGHYICINWDQFASGRSYGLNRFQRAITFEEDLEDLHRLVLWLCGRFRRKKLIICGHSWGTILGLEYARRHPERLLAYMAIGQCVNYRREAMAALQRALPEAEREGHKRHARLFRRFYRNLRSGPYRKIASFARLQYLIDHYLDYTGRTTLAKHMAIALLSPYYRLWDNRHYLYDRMRSQRHLIRHMIDTYDAEKLMMRFHVPMLFLSGDHDWVTPWPVVRNFAARVQAPLVRYERIHGCGHNPFTEAPARTALMIHRMLRQALDLQKNTPTEKESE